MSASDDGAWIETREFTITDDGRRIDGPVRLQTLAEALEEAKGSNPDSYEALLAHAAEHHLDEPEPEQTPEATS